MSDRNDNAWRAAMAIIRSLRDRSHVAYLAGGCVRDRLLNLEPKDYDVATDATPDEVRSIFPRARLVGAKFGVVVVAKFGAQTEVATFRCDGVYSDGRRPDEVVFGSEIEDARRRDFTINGLFFDPIDERVTDHVGGQDDLRAGIIRTIGDPELRFAEDHLRMLRGVRLSARLGFEIEPGTADAIRRLGVYLRAISPERVWQELEQMLRPATRATGWQLLVDLGLHDDLSSELPSEDESWRLAIERLRHLPASEIDPEVPLAAILLDCDVAVVERAGRSLRLSNQQLRKVLYLVRSIAPLRRHAELELADLKILMADPAWPMLFDLFRMDALHRGDRETLAALEDRAAGIPADAIAPPPFLTGEDVAAFGVAPGPRMGAILDQVYRAQLNEVICKKDSAIDLALRLTKDLH